MLCLLAAILAGCGILGVQADLCGNVAVKDCEIYECSQGGIQMSDVVGIAIDNCTFQDLEGSSIFLCACRDAVIDGQSVSGNCQSNDYTYPYGACLLTFHALRRSLPAEVSYPFLCSIPVILYRIFAPLIL